jgi:type I restriction enzyme, S subunit
MKSKLRLSHYSEILMGQSPKGNTCNSDGIGIPLLNGPTEFGSRCPIAVQFTSDTKRISQIGDILFCVRGSTTGKMNYADKEYAIGRGLAAIRGINGFPTAFVKGLIEQNLQRLLNIATGSTFPNVSKEMINSFEVEEVSVDRAIQIAHILSTLDDKIELNRKMNQTLEEMAQALFKSWFVEFDPVHAKAKCSTDEELEIAAKELGISKDILELFPSEFEEGELGMIPKGWDYRKITEICSTIGSGGTPRRMQDDNFNGNINWFTTKELRNGFVLNSIETITDKGLNSSSAKLFPVNTIIMAIYAAPTVGRLGILTQESTFNQAACGFVADDNYVSYEFLYLYLQDKNGYLNNLANGAAQQNLNVGLVKNLDVLIAHKSIMLGFKAVVESIFKQIKNNIEQIQTLQKTRDTLLPKLLSGELDVSECDFK